MIILTGYQGFIGKAFVRKLSHKEIYRVEAEGAFDFLRDYEDWDKGELIINQGAISSTVETYVDKIYKYNIDFSNIDAIFCCVPHGTTQDIIAQIPKDIKICDL